MGALQLRVDAGEIVEVGCHKLLAFVGNMVATLAPLAPAIALRLHLQCAMVADAVKEESDAYEFLTQARARPAAQP